MIRVYVAAPYADAGLVRDVHARLADLGIGYTSTWAHHALGAEDFARFTLDELRREIDRNDRDVRRAEILLVLARDGAGGEMFAEARFAWELGKSIIWVGRRTLSAYRANTWRVDDVDAALLLLKGVGR